MYIFYRLLLIFLFCLALLTQLVSEEAVDYAIRIDAKLDTVGGLKVVFKWLPDSNAKQYTIKRKLISENEWNLTLAELDSTANSFTDSTIEPAIAYEYFIKKKSVLKTDTTDFIYDGYAYISIAEKFEIPRYNGRLLLLIDSTITDSLEYEIERFIYDLTGDGWWVVPKIVPRTEIFNPDAVKYIKSIVVDEFVNHPDSLSALIILGRVAVPYSGNNGVDGHANHQGAWVSDVYYSDIFGEYTDNKLLDTIAVRLENRNIPGDGKFDNTLIANESKLMLGRIDFYYIRYFKIPEKELYRNYLNKNHDFRTRKIIPSYKAYIDDNFQKHGEIFASMIWSDFSALFGIDSTIAGDFVRPLDSEPIIMSFGCGAGSDWGVTNTLSLFHLDTANTGGIFSMLFGSYNGDWDNRDNILRAQLAFSKYALTCHWPGRPVWHHHHLSLGLPIGYTTRISQNNQVLYESNGKYGYRYTHVSLLGDPTLKMYYEELPYNLQISSEISQKSKLVNLSWNYDDSDILGFDVYRSNNILSKFEKVNSEIIRDNYFADSLPNDGKNIYMLRAVKQRFTKAGSIINYSQGIFAETEIPYIDFTAGLKMNLSLLPNPATTAVNITYVIPKESQASLSIWDDKGKLVKVIAEGNFLPRYYSLYWDLKDSRNKKVQSGIYFVKLETNYKSLIAKLNVIH
jgi:hypothetical protein